MQSLIDFGTMSPVNGGAGTDPYFYVVEAVPEPAAADAKGGLLKAPCASCQTQSVVGWDLRARHCRRQVPWHSRKP